MAKRSPIAIYKLGPILDNPRFEGFGMLHGPSMLGHDNIMDDLATGYKRLRTQGWNQPKLAAHWKPLPVKGRVWEKNDFPCLALSDPSFSRRAVDALDTMLTKAGELLPIESEVGEYFAFNTTAVSDALDINSSEVVQSQVNPLYMHEVLRFEFNVAELQGLDVFRLRCSPSYFLVSDRFLHRCQEAKLLGFSFRKVWPLPLSKKWKDLPPLELDGGIDRTKTAQHTLILRLPLTGEPSALNKQKPVVRAEAALEKFLGQTSATYRGSLSGTDSYGGHARFFIQCGDVDALAVALIPWVKALKWKGVVRGVKKYGTVFDDQAKFVDIDFPKD